MLSLKHVFQVSQPGQLPQRVEAAWPRRVHSTADGFQYQPGLWCWGFLGSLSDVTKKVELKAAQLVVTSGVVNNPGEHARRAQVKLVETSSPRLAYALGLNDFFPLIGM